MVRHWRILGAVSIVAAVVAEALNVLAPEKLFIQWVLFILAVVGFILAVTAWDRQRRPGGDGR